MALKRKPLDNRLPAIYSLHREDVGNYEGTLVAAISEYVRSDDRVVIVGGGLGVTVVSAAKQVGPSGSILCFEGAAECVRNVEEAIRLNDVRDRVTVKHAVVAKSISVYGAEPEGAVVAPAELPACDVLELDCEGAELDILAQMTIRPRVILVETHGLYGAPTATIQASLQSLGYAVLHKGVAEEGKAEYCKEQDIHILAAFRVAADSGNS